MKLVHLSDLHIGKILNNYSLIEDHRYIFEQILEKLNDIRPDGIIIAGDVFDRSNPSEEATALYGWFVVELNEYAPVYIIAGNHDSGSRLELFKESLSESGIYIVGKYREEIEKFVLEADGDKVNIYMLPFFTPLEISQLTGKTLKTYDQAFKEIFKDFKVDKNETNILVSHQMFINSKRELDDNEAQIIEIGELEQIGTEGLEDFDYVALGHLHNNQRLKDTNIYYSGTPLKFTTDDRDKYFNLIDINSDGVSVEKIKLEPMRDFKVLEGSFNDIILHEDTDDYVAITLTDKKIVDNAKKKLEQKFPHILYLRFKIEMDEQWNPETESVLKEKPIDLLENFYNAKGRELTEEERIIAADVFDELERDGDETA